MDFYLTEVAAHFMPCLAIFIASLIQSLTGIGLVIVAAPLLMLFYDPKLVVPIMLLIASCANLVQGFLYRKNTNRSIIGFLYAGVVLGQPIGFAIFDAMDSEHLKFLIHTTILLSLLVMDAFHLRVREYPRNSFFAGIFSGITSITTGMAGPPLLIYLSHTAMPQQTMRSTCFVFFLLCNTTALTSYIIGGYDLTVALQEIRYLLPALAIGIIIGHVCYDYVPKAFIKRFIFIVLYVTAIYGIIQVLYTKFF